MVVQLSGVFVIRVICGIGKIVLAKVRDIYKIGNLILIGILL